MLLCGAICGEIVELTVEHAADFVSSHEVETYVTHVVGDFTFRCRYGS
jgi:hypothetical protein